MHKYKGAVILDGNIHTLHYYVPVFDTQIAVDKRKIILEWSQQGWGFKNLSDVQ